MSLVDLVKTFSFWCIIEYFDQFRPPKKFKDGSRQSQQFLLLFPLTPEQPVPETADSTIFIPKMVEILNNKSNTNCFEKIRGGVTTMKYWNILNYTHTRYTKIFLFLGTKMSSLNSIINGIQNWRNNLAKNYICNIYAFTDCICHKDIVLGIDLKLHLCQQLEQQQQQLLQFPTCLRARAMLSSGLCTR